MLLRLCLVLVVALAPLPLSAADPKPKHGLDIYFIDVEGGAATLIVTPARESILIDCGYPNQRDADRIHHTATKIAGLKAIDHLIITHWHLDHYGSVGRLIKLMPIRHYHDRGIPDTLSEDKTNFPVLIRAYKNASGGKSNTLKPGDEIKLAQAPGSPPVKLLCVCASGEVIAEKPGATANPLARDHKPQPVDTSDNARSVGVVLSFGDWRFLDLGDLTWNIEHKLVSPSDRLGPIDVYQVTHHGLEISNNPVLLRTVKPRVSICNNGPRKGGHASVVGNIRRLPDFEALYQLHRNVTTGDGENTDADRIANDSRKKEFGNNIHLRVAPDARTYTVTVREKAFSHSTRGSSR